MIGFIKGKVLFSDGTEVLLLTEFGIGYQVFCSSVMIEGSVCSLYASHVIREDSEKLFGFQTLQDKKLFETLITVKGVGPKSAFSLVTTLGVEQICSAVTSENKKLLSSAPGVGGKSAAQIILDLGGKIHKIKMFSSTYTSEVIGNNVASSVPIIAMKDQEIRQCSASVSKDIVGDAILACSELGFKEDKIIPIIHGIMGKNELDSPEQLVHLVLKEV